MVGERVDGSRAWRRAEGQLVAQSYSRSSLAHACVRWIDDHLAVASSPVVSASVTHDPATPAFDLEKSETQLKALAVETIPRVEEIDPRHGGKGVRRFVAMLKAGDLATARKRVSMRARLFTTQGGRCAACRQVFSTTRRASAQLNDESQMLCAECARAWRTRSRKPVPVKSDPRS